HLDPAAAHVLHLGDLVKDLPRRIENEIRKHEIDDRPCAGHGGSAGQTHKSPFANRCITEAFGPVQVKKPLSRPEVSTPLADTFSEDEDGWVIDHRRCQGLMRGPHKSDLTAGWRRLQ